MRPNWLLLIVGVLLLPLVDGRFHQSGFGQELQRKTAKLSLPGEVDLATLVDYVSQRLEIHILYDNKLASKKINIRLQKKCPSTHCNRFFKVRFGSMGWR